MFKTIPTILLFSIIQCGVFAQFHFYKEFDKPFSGSNNRLVSTNLDSSFSYLIGYSTLWEYRITKRGDLQNPTACLLCNSSTGRLNKVGLKDKYIESKEYRFYPDSNTHFVRKSIYKDRFDNILWETDSLTKYHGACPYNDSLIFTVSKEYDSTYTKFTYEHKTDLLLINANSGQKVWSFPLDSFNVSWSNKKFKTSSISSLQLKNHRLLIGLFGKADTFENLIGIMDLRDTSLTFTKGKSNNGVGFSYFILDNSILELHAGLDSNDYKRMVKYDFNWVAIDSIIVDDWTGYFRPVVIEDNRLFVLKYFSYDYSTFTGFSEYRWYDGNKLIRTCKYFDKNNNERFYGGIGALDGGIYFYDYTGVLKTDSLGIAPNTEIDCRCTTTSNVEKISTGQNTIVWPNPSKGLVNVELPQKLLLSSVNVRNSFGQVILKVEELREHIISLDLSELSNGVYYIEVVHRNGIVKKKLVVDQ